MDTLAVLVAAGRGARMGSSRPKAFLEVAGEPMLLRAARALAECPAVDAVVAVVPEAELDEAGRLLRPVAKLQAVVKGGPRRQDSVLEGMKQAPDGFDGIVLVHDAARPLVPGAVVAAVVAKAREVGAALPVLAVADTLKRVNEGRIVDTIERVDRGVLVAAQTPQAFRFALLARAYEEAFRERVTLTDEAMAVERLGEPVAVVPGSETNRKLTTPDDLAWAEDLLRRATVPA
jgi:2-C-methyl-D-erythritol 4-phosphate cytidylyltransferase